MSIFDEAADHMPSRRLQATARTLTTFSPPQNVPMGALGGVIFGGSISGAIPLVVCLATLSAGTLAGLVGAKGLEAGLDAASHYAAMTTSFALLGAITASAAWVVDVLTIRRTAEALGASELRRMSGIEPFLNFASAMKDDQWLVKDAGANAMPRVISWDDYCTWRDKVDASDVPLVLLTVGNVQKDFLAPNLMDLVKSDSCRENDVLIARKLVNSRVVGFTEEDPFMRIYWASEKAMKAHGFNETALEGQLWGQDGFDDAFNEPSFCVTPELRTAYDSMPGKGILAGERDAPYDYGVAHRIRDQADELVNKFADGVMRMFGAGRDPAADASVSLDGATPRL